MLRRNWQLGIIGITVFAMLGVLAMSGTADAWQPRKPVEIVIPAGQGGGADVMGRFISTLIGTKKFAKKPFIVVNKPGGSGAVGMQYLFAKKGNPHYFMISLSNVITTPLHTKLGITWRDLTPIVRMALDRHCLCVNQKFHPEWKSVKDVVKSIKDNPKGTFKLGGTGSKQEDQIVALMFQREALGAMDYLTYVPFKGGGTVAANLVGGHIDLNVNNPSEFLPHSRANRLTVLAMFDKDPLPDMHMMDDTTPRPPTVKEAGYNVVYEMLRGIFGPPKMKKGEIQYYIALLDKVNNTKEWKRYTDDFFLQRAFLGNSPELTQWFVDYEELHRKLLKGAGLM
jgi:tripartite-type tricarboxylate transporter receptor subunit TctC